MSRQENDMTTGAMVEGAQVTDVRVSVATAKRRHTEARKAVEAARAQLAETRAGLDGALQERSRLDAQLDDGAPVDASDLSAQIAANATTTEALARQRDRRKEALRVAEDAQEQARKGVALAELLTLRDDLDGFDVEAEKARLLALVQDEYSAILDTLYGFQDRIRKARQWAKEAQGLGVRVKAPDEWNSSSSVEVEGRPLVAPATVAGAREWFADGLVDERREAEREAGREENRRRFREAQAAQVGHQQAGRDAMPSGMNARHDSHR